MVNLKNMLGIEPDPNWEKMDWLPSIPENQEDEEAMNEWICRYNMSMLLYGAELLKREDYFKKHGSLLKHLSEINNKVGIRKGKRSPRIKKRGKIVLLFNEPRNDEGKDDEKPKKKIKKSCYIQCPVPSLSEEFKNCIKRLGGSDDNAMLVIQKALYKTDVNSSHGRLSIPLSQVKNEFLTEEEEKHLASDYDRKVPEIEVKLIEPSLADCKINLKKWNMNSTETYVLVTTWNSVVQRNELKDGMMVQLWSFRVGSQLGFALVKL